MKAAITLFALAASSFAALENNLLNIAILQLPDRYLAGIPMGMRTELLKNLSMNPSDDRLDYANGLLRYNNDNPYRSIGATSVFSIKLLPRKDRSPLLFISIPHRSDGIAPPRILVAILERTGDRWGDVTESMMPAEVDPKGCFVPRRESPVIQVASFVQKERADGLGKFWADGPRTAELRWNGRALELRRVRPAKLAYD